ncbi:uncharacterized protein LOC135220818 isoform X2 [Macrobrachium nipponense]|uniref:uncharacterized protein LOC135220818 isoform X2 n=1 Tax=Macrobrachium nipponense TaxID=159736 RepID=UPI0030C863A5
MLKRVTRTIMLVCLQLLTATCSTTSEQLSAPFERKISTEDLQGGPYSLPWRKSLEPQLVFRPQPHNQGFLKTHHGVILGPKQQNDRLVLSEAKEEDSSGQPERTKRALSGEPTPSIEYHFSPLISLRSGFPDDEHENETHCTREKSKNHNVHHRTKKDASDEDQLTSETSQSSADHALQPIFPSTSSENEPILSLNGKQGEAFLLEVSESPLQPSLTLVTSPFKEPPPLQGHVSIPHNEVPDVSRPIRFQHPIPPVITASELPPNKFQDSIVPNRHQDNAPISLPPYDHDNHPTTKQNPISIGDPAFHVEPSPTKESAFLKLEPVQAIPNEHAESAISSLDGPGVLRVHRPPETVTQIDSFIQKDPDTNPFGPPVYIPSEGVKLDLGFPKQTEPATYPLETKDKLHDHSDTDDHILPPPPLRKVSTGILEPNSGDLTSRKNPDILIPSTDTHTSAHFPTALPPTEDAIIEGQDQPQIDLVSSSAPYSTLSEVPHLKNLPALLRGSEISPTPGPIDPPLQKEIPLPPSREIQIEAFLTNTNFQEPSPYFQAPQTASPLITPYNPYTTLFMPQFGGGVGIGGGSPFSLFPQVPLFNYPLIGGNFFN